MAYDIATSLSQQVFEKRRRDGELSTPQLDGRLCLPQSVVQQPVRRESRRQLAAVLEREHTLVLVTDRRG